jgi:hypothetical protein
MLELINYFLSINIFFSKKDLNCMWKFCKWVNEEEAMNDNKRKNLNTKKEASQEQWFWSKILQYIDETQDYNNL